MQKCQHNRAVAKFCLFEHCQSKEPGGCQDCIKKYHNHIGQITFLNEDDIKNIVKKFQIEANYRPKSRSLQECIFNFFSHIKSNISQNLDFVCKSLINQIGYPFLQKSGSLNCYKRLKNKQFRKVSQKELKEIWELYKTTENNEIIKEEKRIYSQAVIRIQETLEKMQKNIKETFENFSNIVLQGKSNLALYDRTFYLKVNDIFKQIKKYPIVAVQKKQQPTLIKKENTKIQEKLIEKKKPTRDVSLDRQIKIQNKFKTYIKAKTEEKQKNDSEKVQQIKQDRKVFKQTKQIVKKPSLRQEDYLQKKQAEKDTKTKRLQKYSVDLRPQEVTLRPQQKVEKNDLSFNDFSQKQQEILQRKKKLLDLMNSKPVNKKQPSQENNDIQILITPVRDKQSISRSHINEASRFSLQSDRLNLANLLLQPINIEKKFKELPTSSINQLQKMSQKRVKTTFDDQEQQSTLNEKKYTRNQTMMSSQTETEDLFHANINIPIDDTKQQEEFQISEESVQKCIFVPEVDVLARQILNMHSQCQSPLLIKKKEIQKFSALIKLAESKFIEQQTPQKQKVDTKPQNHIDSSVIKINRILQSQVKETTSNLKEEQSTGDQTRQMNGSQLKESRRNLQKLDSVQIDQKEQQSISLLLNSLKLPGPQAINYLEKAIQFSPNNLSAAEYLSYLYLQAQRPQDCLKLCNDVLKSISSSETNDLALRLNINKSAALNHLGRYSECITFLQRCLRHRHNDLLYKNLADAYCSIGILQKAIYNYEHAIIQNSANTEAHYNLAVCHYQQQNYYNASIYIEKALKHQPNNPIYKEMKDHVDQKILASPVV